MKRYKILYICLGVLMLIDVELGKYTLERKAICERMHWNDVDRTKEAVPDEEVARKLAEIYLDTGETFFGLSTDLSYDAQITYDEQGYGWKIYFTPTEMGDDIWLDATQYVWIRKDYGTMNYIYNDTIITDYGSMEKALWK